MAGRHATACETGVRVGNVGRLLRSPEWGDRYQPRAQPRAHAKGRSPGNRPRTRFSPERATGARRIRLPPLQGFVSCGLETQGFALILATPSYPQAACGSSGEHAKPPVDNSAGPTPSSQQWLHRVGFHCRGMVSPGSAAEGTARPVPRGPSPELPPPPMPSQLSRNQTRCREHRCIRIDPSVRTRLDAETTPL